MCLMKSLKVKSSLSMFKSEEIVDLFWKILKSHKQEKMCDNCVRLEFSESRTKSF
jgi:hypothetical protein